MKVNAVLGVGVIHDLFTLSSSDELLEQGVIDMTDHIQIRSVSAVYIRRKLKWWMHVLNFFGAKYQESQRVAIDLEEGELRQTEEGNFRDLAVRLKRFDLKVVANIEFATVVGSCLDPQVEAFELDAWRENANRRPQAA